MCRPCVLSPTSEGGPFLRIISGKHPCISQTYSGEEFIPNDVVIEGQRLCTVVTGPNMGGKSTLMRQAGLIVILAQLVSKIVFVVVTNIPCLMITGLLCSSGEL